MANISITRGDTKQFKFQRKSNGQVITTEADEIFFTVKRNNNVENFVFQKTIDDMDFDEEYFYHFTINPEDTNNLPYGTYAYDIEVKIDNYVKTIALGNFEITKEVTFYTNEGE